MIDNLQTAKLSVKLSDITVYSGDAVATLVSSMAIYMCVA